MPSSWASSRSETWRASQPEMTVTRRSSARRRSRLTDIGSQENVLADLLSGQTSQVDRVRQRRDQALAVAGEAWRDEHEQLVDEAGPEEGGGERRPAFEQKAADAFAGEGSELVLERPRAELELGAFRQRPAAESEPARLAGHLDSPGGQLRIVRTHRSHPDRDRVRLCSELVDPPPALLAGDPARARHRHAPVERHRDLVGHE